jgi:hypothetical protein
VNYRSPSHPPVRVPCGPARVWRPGSGERMDEACGEGALSSGEPRQQFAHPASLPLAFAARAYHRPLQFGGVFGSLRKRTRLA